MLFHVFLAAYLPPANQRNVCVASKSHLVCFPGSQRAHLTGEVKEAVNLSQQGMCFILWYSRQGAFFGVLDYGVFRLLSCRVQIVVKSAEYARSAGSVGSSSGVRIEECFAKVSHKSARQEVPTKNPTSTHGPQRTSEGAPFIGTLANPNAFFLRNWPR